MKAIAIGYHDRAGTTPPLLSAEEEAALCRRWHEHHDIAAAGRLIDGHLRMVAAIAMAHRGRGVSQRELIGEGYVGLMRAACRYDPACGTRFATYATWWVQAAIRQSVLRVSHFTQADLAGDRGATVMPTLCVRGSRQRTQVQFVS